MLDAFHVVCSCLGTEVTKGKLPRKACSHVHPSLCFLVLLPPLQTSTFRLCLSRRLLLQRNSPPSPPLMSALPPKRPRSPGGDHDHDPSHGKRPRSGERG